MCKEGICQIWIFRFLRSKRLNLEVQKKWGMDIEMSLYLRKCKYFVMQVYWWNVVYCIGVWVVTFNFWFLKIFIWFLGRAKVWVEKSFFIENYKWILGNSFGWYVDIVVKQCVNVPFGQICSIWVCAKWVPKLWILSEKCKNFDKKVSQIRAS